MADGWARQRRQSFAGLGFINLALRLGWRVPLYGVLRDPRTMAGSMRPIPRCGRLRPSPAAGVAGRGGPRRGSDLLGGDGDASE